MKFHNPTLILKGTTTGETLLTFAFLYNDNGRDFIPHIATAEYHIRFHSCQSRTDYHYKAIMGTDSPRLDRWKLEIIPNPNPGLFPVFNSPLISFIIKVFQSSTNKMLFCFSHHSMQSLESYPRRSAVFKNTQTSLSGTNNQATVKVTEITLSLYSDIWREHLLFVSLSFCSLVFPKAVL